MYFKKCNLCQLEKEIVDFPYDKSKAGNRIARSYCKSCKNMKRKKSIALRNKRDKQRERSHQRRLRNNEFIKNYLTSKNCVDCGETRLAVLEFDHVRGNKSKCVSDLKVKGYAISRLIDEIKKCDVRCSNCHKIKTARENNWYVQ